MSDTSLQQFCVLVMMLRGKGASLRAIAKLFGYSKSTLHRHLPAIELIAAEVSQMGQSDKPNDRTPRHGNTGLSQTGQGGRA